MLGTAAAGGGALAAAPAGGSPAAPRVSPKPPPGARSKARFVEAREALRRWRLTEAAALLAAKPPRGRAVLWTILRARLDLQRARYDDVIRRLQPLVRAHPRAYEARVLLGRALLARGKTQAAVDAVDPMATDWNDGRVTSARDLMWLAVGLELSGYFKNANEIFADALRTDPKLAQAKVLWAELFARKYNDRDADALLAEVLRDFPDDPDALVARGRVDLSSGRDIGAARDKALAVLRASPECVPAHNLLARVELESERPRAAVARLEGYSLKLAPQDLDALALLGAAYFVADDDAAFRAVERRALKVNPRFSAFYRRVAAHAARLHRYDEAIALDRKAIALNPEDWNAWADLGMGMSRVGDDAKAREYLDRAFQGDPYDVRTYNLLEFFYDRVIKDFEWVDAGPMRVRLHRDERPVLARYVPALLEEAWGHFTEKYGFTPTPPTHVEIFPDPQLFAIRSIGLPRLGAHGICFGHVITARSPKPGDFNWGEVLWHELSHVFHIQLSHGRVPRWFTEGLAVYESTEGRPAWRREMDDALLGYREAGKLRGVGDFNLAFTQARSMRDMLVAYYHASVVAEFLVRTYGFPKVRAMLVAWGQRKDTPTVVREVLGVDVAALDQALFAWIDRRLAARRGRLHLQPDRFGADPARWLRAAKAAPKDAEAQVDAAEAALAKGDGESARTFAEAALALAGEGSDAQARALLVRARERLGQGAAGAVAARADLERLLALGRDARAVRVPLARLAVRDKRWGEAVRHLEAAARLDPGDGALLHQLVQTLVAAQKAGAKEGTAGRIFRWRRVLARVDQADVGTVDALLAAAEAQGASREDVLRWGEQGNHVAPFSAAHHVAFARELARLGDAERARFEARSALLLDPDNQAAKALLAGTPEPTPAGR